MKALKTLLAVLAVLTLVFTASAQNALPQLDPTRAYTNTGVFAVLGGTTTNLTAAQKSVVRLSDKGFGFNTLMGSTNAAVTTNLLFRFEFSVDGTNYWQQYTFSWAPGGAGGSVGGTNIAADLTRNYQYARLYSIQNTNVATGTASNLTVFLTNANFSVRQ